MFIELFSEADISVDGPNRGAGFVVEDDVLGAALVNEKRSAGFIKRTQYSLRRVGAVHC